MVTEERQDQAGQATEAGACIECGAPRFSDKNGRVYTRCGACLYTRRTGGTTLARRAAEAPAVLAQPTPPTTTRAPAAPAQPDVVEAAAPRTSDLPGILTDMLLLVDRSREAVTEGQIDALRVAIEVRGARVSMGVDAIEKREAGD